MNSNPSRRGGVPWISLFIIFVICLLLATPVIVFFGGLFPNYSIGERTGVVTKLSLKGMIWKANEGEMLVGGNATDSNGTAFPIIWTFSVKDNATAKAIATASEKGVRVTLHYHQYWIKSICYDTSIIVDGLKIDQKWVIAPPGEEVH